MEQLQRKRESFRVAIRRSDLDSRMGLVRAQLTDDFHVACCKSFINHICASKPYSLFIELASYLSTCLPAERKPWASVCSEMLTSVSFSRWQGGFEGLSSLLLVIDDQLSEKCLRMLPSPAIIEALLGELEDGARGEASRQQQLFRIAFQLSINASKQSKFHINLSEERVEVIINRAHSCLTISSLQTLALVLVNLDEEDLRLSLRKKIKEIGRSLYRWIDLADDRHFYLQLLTLIGTHCCFEQSDADIVKLLLDETSGLDFSLALRFLSIQSASEWITFQDTRKFLNRSKEQMKGIEKAYFLISVLNIIQSQIYNEQIMMQIYNDFFKGRLYFYTTPATIRVAAQLIILYFMEKRSEIMDELLFCAQLILKMDFYILERLCKDHLFMLTHYLVLNDQIQEKDICLYIGEANTVQYWEKYAENSQNDDC